MSIWLSWSAFKQFKTCEKQYYLRRVKKQDPPIPDSRHNAIIGSVNQQVFEDFYNRELWRKGSDTSEELLRIADEYFWKFVDEEYIDWNDPRCRFSGPYDVLNELLDIVPKTLEGIKRERFLGPYAKSEVNIKVRFGPSDYLLGYLDFVIRKQDNEMLLIDGKASRHREKYVDVEQLYFYALLFYLRYKRLPDRMGFFYYRFADDPEQAMDWIPVEKDKIKALRIEIEDMLYEVRQKEFPANPVAQHCQWCDYETICDERQKQKKVNRAKRQMRSTKPEIKADFGDSGKAFIGFDNLSGNDDDT